MKRIIAIVLCIVLLAGLSVSVPVTAAEGETILLAGSDFQVSAHNTSRIEQVLSTLEIHGITKADGAFFCGDYALNSVDDNQGQSSAGLAVLKNLFTPIVGSKMTFVQGNHDPADTAGLSKSGNNDPASGKYGVYVIHEDEYLQYDWDYSRGVVEKTAANLKQYLDQKVSIGWTKPIFVLSHVGLHWGNRTIREGSAIHGELLVDVLNEAGEKGLNIIFLYGHDHSGGIADFIGGSAVYFKKGDQIEVCTGQKKEHTTRTIKFTYMNAGYIGYYSTNEPTCDATVTMSVFRIRGDEVIITRYDGNINFLKEQYGIHNLKSKGVWHPDYSQEGYHAQPNTLEYASSRKVTATDDVYVDTPMPISHDYAPATCTTPKTCTICGATEGKALGHKYTNACDKICNRNGCTYKRTVNSHVYDDRLCDKDCNICGATRKPAHLYTDSCDIDCNLCGSKRKITHTYSNDCDEYCNVCSEWREVQPHVYSHRCDRDCNSCGFRRTVTHKYSNKCDNTCNYCRSKRKVAAHTYKTAVGKKATLTANGYTIKTCTECKKTTDDKTVIRRVGHIKLSATTYTYDGKVKKPTVTIKDSYGNKITTSNYTVTYASGRKNVGTYKVTVKFKGKYSGTKTLTFKINPAKTSVKSLTAAKKSLKVAIAKKTTQVTGYQVQYSTTKSFKSYKTKNLTSYKKTSLTLSGLSAKKTYYVRVRTYKTVNGVKYYSGWSTIKYKKTK